MRGITDYLNGVKAEVSKVDWPKKSEVVKLTLIVFIFSGIVATYLGIIDFAFTNVLNKLILK